MPYIPHTDRDVREMLAVIGAPDLEALTASVPESLRLKQPLNLPPALTELELTALLTDLAARNAAIDARPHFLGMGCYDHFVPAVVDHVASRSEFLTAYTPYQPEASQGALQAFYEFQTLVCQLTGMEVANASLYDGASALAEAALLGRAVTNRTRLLVPDTLHPHYRQVLSTYLANVPLAVQSVPHTAAGTLDLPALKSALKDDVAAVVVANPNVFGVIEDVATAAKAAHAAGALLVALVDPISCGLLRRPGDCGADVVVAEGQSLGTPPSFGGPSLGLFATREAHIRRLPGRLVGQTVDRRGRRAFVLTLQTREQHIRRERATSNICTNQGLIAIRAAAYLAAVGPRGLRQVAALCLQKAHYAAEQIAAVPGFQLAFSGPFFKEFAVRTPIPPAEVNRRLLDHNLLGGVDLGRFRDDWRDLLLLCVTEKRTRAEIDRLVDVLKGIRP
jgi:glycine dehydrogenase subunit 1